MLQRPWPQFEIHHFRRNRSDCQKTCEGEWSTDGAKIDCFLTSKSWFHISMEMIQKEKNQINMSNDIYGNPFHTFKGRKKLYLPISHDKTVCIYHKWYTNVTGNDGIWKKVELIYTNYNFERWQGFRKYSKEMELILHSLWHCLLWLADAHTRLVRVWISW